MDAFIAAEARQALDALNVLSPGKKRSGILLGHKRGHRFIVEKIFPAPKGFGFDGRSILRLDELFAGKVIGFYSSGDLARFKAGLRQPAAAGRLLLAVRKARLSTSLNALAVDFDGRFRFVPIRLLIEEAAP